ncbi:MAG: hypothetical protein NC231_02220 [Bacillus sp. (in: Bacteria)]|nr:hypothetical protein [Bacillus sp. (in: firmicutes)]MCM1426156.1 hypothetical protein [Eubacterium sp.]
MPFARRSSQLKHLSFSTEKEHGFLYRHADVFLFFLFLAAFYAFLLYYIKPVDGINDDFGMYSMLSGAYLGEPDAHVLFFLYPLSWLLCCLYKINSAIPWYGLFQHGVHIICIWLLYHRMLQLQKKHFQSDSVILPSLGILTVLFFIVDFNIISEAQYTTTAGFCAATALFYFITTKSDESPAAFLKGNIPTFILAWLTFSMRQNVLYMLLPIAGLLWLSKWLLSNQRFYADYMLKLFSFVGILFLGMGILYGVHMIAYSEEEWSDFMKINHYRERVGDFYTWPEYDECSYELTALGIDEEAYSYMRGGAPHVGYQMSVEDWEHMYQIAKDCYHARTPLISRLQNIAVGTLSVFLYQDGMQPLNLCTAVLLLFTLCCILYRKNTIALAVYLLYLAGRMVTWGYLLYEGRFPKRIIQPLIVTDVIVLCGILTAFNLIKINRKVCFAFILPCIIVLSAFSVYCTKTNIDSSYHVNRAVWEDLKEYCYEHPDNFYIWTYDSGTLDNYCESPFDTTLDAYQNFFYTNWGVACNPNSRKKLANHGIGEFGEDLVQSRNVYFIFKEGLYYREHPVIMYFRHTYNVKCELADTFNAGGNAYEVYQLR